MIDSDVLFLLSVAIVIQDAEWNVPSPCLIAVSSKVNNGRLRDVDTAATIVIFLSCGGLAVGSVASFGIMALVYGCNRFVGWEGEEFGDFSQSQRVAGSTCLSLGGCGCWRIRLLGTV